jgi:hypothetical protein
MSEDIHDFKAKALASTAALETNQMALLRKIAQLEENLRAAREAYHQSVLREAELQTQVNMLKGRLQE